MQQLLLGCSQTPQPAYLDLLFTFVVLVQRQRRGMLHASDSMKPIMLHPRVYLRSMWQQDLNFCLDLVLNHMYNLSWDHMLVTPCFLDEQKKVCCCILAGEACSYWFMLVECFVCLLFLSRIYRRFGWHLCHLVLVHSCYQPEVMKTCMY